MGALSSLEDAAVCWKAFREQLLISLSFPETVNSFLYSRGQQ
jgi:hypothetical protein